MDSKICSIDKTLGKEYDRFEKQIELTQSEVRQINPVRGVELIKCIIVSLALGCVFGGVASILWTGYVENGDRNSVHHLKYNSYFGGMIRLVKSNFTQGASADASPTRGTIKVLLDAPEWLKYVVTSLSSIYDVSCQFIVNRIYKQEYNTDESIGQEETSQSNVQHSHASPS